MIEAPSNNNYRKEDLQRKKEDRPEYGSHSSQERRKRSLIDDRSVLSDENIMKSPKFYPNAIDQSQSEKA